MTNEIYLITGGVLITSAVIAILVAWMLSKPKKPKVRDTAARIRRNGDIRPLPARIRP